MKAIAQTSQELLLAARRAAATATAQLNSSSPSLIATLNHLRIATAATQELVNRLPPPPPEK